VKMDAQFSMKPERQGCFTNHRLVFSGILCLPFPGVLSKHLHVGSQSSGANWKHETMRKVFLHFAGWFEGQQPGKNNFSPLAQTRNAP